MDQFRLEAVSIEEVQRAVIGHTGVGLGAGWFLDKLVIREMEGDKREYLLPCQRWLDDHHDDKKTTRELKATGEHMYTQECTLYSGITSTKH